MPKRSQRDHWSKEAGRRGYPARSVFKIEEIQNRYSVMAPGASVLDLGAAPGSWTLYALRTLRAHVTAVDLEPLTINAPKGGRLKVHKGDLFSEEIFNVLTAGGPYDTVLSDAAPRTTGNRLVDTRRSLDLASRVLELAEAHLKPGGNLVLKIFQSDDDRTIRDRLKTLFSKSRAFKPRAVRPESFELYLIGRDFL